MSEADHVEDKTGDETTLASNTRLYSISGSSASSLPSSKVENKVTGYVRMNIFDVPEIFLKEQQFTARFYLQVSWTAKDDWGQNKDQVKKWRNENPGKTEPDHKFLKELYEKIFKEHELGVEGPDAGPNLDPTVNFGNCYNIVYKEREWYEVIEKIEEDEENRDENGDPIKVPYICWRTKMVVRFVEQFELKKFPFDCQDLKIVVRADNPQFELTRDRGVWESSCRFDSFTTSNLMAYHKSLFMRTGLEYKAKRSKISEVEFRLKAYRKPGYVIWNVVVPSMLISMLGLSAFTVEPNRESFTDRFEVSGAILLTLVAYKFATVSNLPDVNYLTLADWFMIMQLFTQVVIILWSTLVSIYNLQQYDKDFGIVFSSIWCLINAVCISMCLIYSWRLEWSDYTKRKIQDELLERWFHRRILEWAKMVKLLGLEKDIDVVKDVVWNEEVFKSLPDEISIWREAELEKQGAKKKYEEVLHKELEDSWSPCKREYLMGWINNMPDILSGIRKKVEEFALPIYSHDEKKAGKMLPTKWQVPGTFIFLSSLVLSATGIILIIISALVMFIVYLFDDLRKMFRLAMEYCACNDEKVNEEEESKSSGTSYKASSSGDVENPCVPVDAPQSPSETESRGSPTRAEVILRVFNQVMHEDKVWMEIRPDSAYYLKQKEEKMKNEENSQTNVGAKREHEEEKIKIIWDMVYSDVVPSMGKEKALKKGIRDKLRLNDDVIGIITELIQEREKDSSTNTIGVHNN